jgi:hypothetical protein
VIEEFAPLLEPGDMIIDGSNAHFKGHPQDFKGHPQGSQANSAWSEKRSSRARPDSGQRHDPNIVRIYNFVQQADRRTGGVGRVHRDGVGA